MCCVVWRAEKRLVSIPSASVSRFKTSPCMPATHAHVFQHVRVLPVHTGTPRPRTQPHTTQTTAVTSQILICTDARTAAQRREQRRRVGARFAGRLCRLFAPASALLRARADVQERGSERIVKQIIRIPQEHFSEHIVEQIVDASVPQPMEGIEESDMTPATGVTHAAPSPIIEFVDAPAGSCAAPAPVNEYGAPAIGIINTTPAPSRWKRPREYVAPAPAATDTAPTPVMKYVDPPPAVTYTAPVPVIEMFILHLLALARHQLQ